MKRCPKCGVSDWRILRKDVLGWKQQDFADWLGVSLSTVKRLERQTDHRCIEGKAALRNLKQLLILKEVEEGIARVKSWGEPSPLEDIPEENPYVLGPAARYQPGQGIIWSRSLPGYRSGGEFRATVIAVGRTSLQIEYLDSAGATVTKWIRPSGVIEPWG